MSDSIIVYHNGEIELKVPIEHDTVWLRSEDIALLFGVQRPAVVKHINTIYKSEELDKDATCSILEQLAKDGKVRKINFYNLDMIISVGYRVNSKASTKFRQWATKVLKEYIYNGFAINREKITQQRLLSLEKDVEYIKSHIKDNTIDYKQGIFFDGQIFDAYVFVSDLIKSAKESITLIDNYIDETTLTLFAKVPDIEVTIYTHAINRQLKLDYQKYKKQYDNVTLKSFKNSHDRFLILDGAEVYHIGASLKDLGKKWFAFSRMGMGSLSILGAIDRSYHHTNK